MAASTSDKVQESARRLEVIIAEDDPAARRLLTTAISSLGHVCRAAGDGAEAWAMLQERGADVVISDWQMPGVDGAELCRRVRGVEDAPYTYFIMMTGFDDRDHRLGGMSAGADQYQTKPVDLDAVEAGLVSAARVVAHHRRLEEKTRAMRRDSSQLYRISRTDALTGAGNRLRMHEALEAAMARARRYGQRYALAMFDLDHFKRLNDSLGHVAGDKALVQVTTAIQRAVRAGDEVFRYGGEEIVVLFVEQALDDAFDAATRLRQGIERLGIARSATEGDILTASAGVAELDRHDASIETWLARADAALYAAKSAGRNRVVCA